LSLLKYYYRLGVTNNPREASAHVNCWITLSVSRLAALNKTLNPTHDLSGVFLPVRSPKQFDVMFLAEMPSMNVPKDWVEGQPIPNFAETARDKFLQEMMIKYGVAGSYKLQCVTNFR
jgi:hypothetical protein